MLDFRIKTPDDALNWRYQEIIVTQEYLDEHADDLNLITLDSPYEMGKKVLDVYFNGDRLTEGGGYEEVDTTHIRLDIREYDSDGNEVPAFLKEGDEIVIKEWFNSTSILYSQSGLNNRLTAIEIEVHDARLGFPVLKEKLLDIDRELSNLLGEGNYNINYEYDQDENIIREVVTGDYEITREFTYNEYGKPVVEIITHGNKKTTRTYYYDDETYKIIKVISQTVTV